MNTPGRHLLILTLATLLASAASATTVYRTVDRYGAVSFSDTPPAQATIPAEELHIDTSTSNNEDFSRRTLD